MAEPPKFSVGDAVFDTEETDPAGNLLPGYVLAVGIKKKLRPNKYSDEVDTFVPFENGDESYHPFSFTDKNSFLDAPPEDSVEKDYIYYVIFDGNGRLPPRKYRTATTLKLDKNDPCEGCSLLQKLIGTGLI